MRALLALALCVCATASGAHGLHVSSGSRIGRSSAQSGQAGEAGSNEAGGQPALAFGRQLLLSNSQVTALLHGNGESASKQQHAAILSEQQEALRELALELAVTALEGQHRHPAAAASAAAAADAADAAGPAGSTQRNRDRSREALHYLLQHLPPMDSGKLPLSYLKRNVHLALLARQATPWALHDVPWDMYLNDVLPHASLDEPRDDWRDMMYERFLPLVKNATSLAEAAQILNREIWKIWGIYFKPEQTPEIMSVSQVIAAGYASCTGLSIFLVNACRAVGIPARVAGTPDWVQPPSNNLEAAGDMTKPLELRNHNWVEVWDGQAWSFMGAAEYDPQGFNRTWFFPQPAKGQVPGDRLHAIYAASYRPTPNRTTFPLAWDLGCDWVHARDVTDAYLSA